MLLEWIEQQTQVINMTINNGDKNLVKKQVLKDKEEPKIKTGGLVIGTKTGYQEIKPGTTGEVLVSSNTSSGVEFTREITTPKVRYNLNTSKQSTKRDFEVIVLQGTSTASSASHQSFHGGTATRYSHAIEHNISELRKNLISFSGMLSSADGASWYAVGGSDERTAEGQQVTIGDDSIAVANTTSGTVMYRFTLWVKAGLLSHKDNKDGVK